MTYRSISPLGLAQIEAHEGFLAEAVRFGENAWLVGYGHLAAEKPAKLLSRAEAGALLVADLAPAERAVNELVTHEISQPQHDALVSFVHSIGAEAFAKSEVLRRVNKGEFVSAACAMDAWRKSAVSGEAAVYEVLVRRRAAEKALFLSERMGAPSAWLKPELDHAAAILGAPAAFTDLPVMGEVAGEGVVVEESQPLTPANDCGPLDAAHRMTPVSQPRPAVQPGRERGQAGLAALAFAGLALLGGAFIVYFRGASYETDLAATLLLAGPGAAALFAGVFFLTRRTRQAFA
ncbi:MAG: lysozyme [Hyphomonadaceae bacterium]